MSVIRNMPTASLLTMFFFQKEYANLNFLAVYVCYKKYANCIFAHNVLLLKEICQLKFQKEFLLSMYFCQELICTIQLHQERLAKYYEGQAAYPVHYLDMKCLKSRTTSILSQTLITFKHAISHYTLALAIAVEFMISQKLTLR